jgi:hypothetical protein
MLKRDKANGQPSDTGCLHNRNWVLLVTVMTLDPTDHYTKTRPFFPAEPDIGGCYVQQDMKGEACEILDYRGTSGRVRRSL